MSVVFDRAALFYDRTRGLPAEAEAWLADAVRRDTSLRAGSRVLEVGVGTGRIALPLARTGYRYTGVDLSAEMMRKLRAKAGGREIKLLRADATRLPFADSTFDAVVAVHVFHLIDDWAAAMDEARRVLRPGGTLLHGLNRHSEDSTMREFRRIFTQAAGATARRRGAGFVEFEAIGPELEARFGAPLRVDSPAWHTTTSPGELIGQLNRRVWSQTWALSDEAIERATREAGDWAMQRWGSLDVRITDEQRFGWEIYTKMINDQR